MTATPIATSVARVVVTTNGALVVRRGRVDAGVQRISIDGLPLRLVDDTLRVRPGSAGLSVGFVQERCRVDIVGGAPDVEHTSLIYARLAVSALEQRAHTLRGLAGVSFDVELPPPDAPGGPDADSLLELLATASRSSKALAEQQQQVAATLRIAQARVRDLEAQQQRDPTPPRVMRGVEVDVSGHGTIEVEYFVTAARWAPTYTLQLTTVDGARRGRLVLGALVAQASGEDWDDVELQVSTGALDRAATLPVVHSWRLGRAQPARVRGFRPLPSDLPSLFAGWDRFGASPRPSPAQAPPPPPPPPPPAAPVVLASSPKALVPMESDGVGMLEEGVAAFDQADDDEVTGSMFAARSSAPPAEMARKSAAPIMSRARLQPPGALGGGGPSGSARSAAAPVVDEVPPRLRTSSLRMAFADERDRGALLELGLRERLAWLLDVADVADAAIPGDTRRAELERALQALEAAEAQLRSRPSSWSSGQRPRVFRGGRTSVASDGLDHRVEVHREDVAVEVVHHTVPRESLDVWRLCLLTPSTALPSGPVQVYEDGAFVVSGHVPGTAGTAMSFNLGVDPDVRVVSRTPHIQQAEKGLMGGTSQVEHRVVTSIRNGRREPVKLHVFDRLPVVEEGTKDLVVALSSSAPPLVRTDRGPDDRPLPGGHRVVVTVMPADTQRLEHTWTLTLPAKLEVVGGNRRE